MTAQQSLLVRTKDVWTLALACVVFMPHVVYAAIFLSVSATRAIKEIPSHNAGV